VNNFTPGERPSGRQSIDGLAEAERGREEDYNDRGGASVSLSTCTSAAASLQMASRFDDFSRSIVRIITGRGIRSAVTLKSIL